jgi:hypothetical protein
MEAADLVRDRVELKYRVSTSDAEALLERLPARRTSWITTTYLDTADRRLLRAARRDPRACVKVRLRSYHDSPLVWVELKERRGERTRKERVAASRAGVPDVLRRLAPGVEVPVGEVRCRRTSVDSGVRLTVDQAIVYRVLGAPDFAEEGAVVELKRADDRVPGWCAELLRGLAPEEYTKFGVISRLHEAPVA